MMYKDKTLCFNEIISYQLVTAGFPRIAVAMMTQLMAMAAITTQQLAAKNI